MRGESSVKDLLESAAGGAESAWQAIVRRYSSLLHAVCRDCGLTGSDADDVVGNVWLRLVVSLGTLRDPNALPGWLVTTCRRECLAVLHEKRRQIPAEHVDRVESDTVQDPLFAEEDLAAVRDALTHLPDRDRRLLSLLFSDPPTPYSAISSTLGMPVGAIGPTRRRCLARARRIPSIAALIRDRCRND